MFVNMHSSYQDWLLSQSEIFTKCMLPCHPVFCHLLCQQSTEDEGTQCIVKALYTFTGTGDDELSFQKGDLIVVTKVCQSVYISYCCHNNIIISSDS